MAYLLTLVPAPGTGTGLRTPAVDQDSHIDEGRKSDMAMHCKESAEIAAIVKTDRDLAAPR